MCVENERSLELGLSLDDLEKTTTSEEYHECENIDLKGLDSQYFI